MKPKPREFPLSGSRIICREHIVFKLMSKIIKISLFHYPLTCSLQIYQSRQHILLNIQEELSVQQNLQTAILL